MAAMVHAMGIPMFKWLMTAKKHQKTWLNPTYPMENPMTSIETWQFTQLLFKWYTCHPSVVEDKM
jgi:hypothetical protein